MEILHHIRFTVRRRWRWVSDIGDENLQVQVKGLQFLGLRALGVKRTGGGFRG